MEGKEETEDMESQSEDLDVPVDEGMDEEGMKGQGEDLEIPVDEEDIEIVALDEEGRELDADEEISEAGGKEAEEARAEYLRLYAEFENYKKRVAKDKEEMARYANESLIIDLLPSLDHLDIALKHSREAEDEDSVKDGFVQGVDMTLRELLRTLEKFGIKQIESQGKPFDPEFHHAVTQAEREDMDEGMVVEELRKGYIYNGKVIRATMVSVSKAPERDADNEEDSQRADE